MVYKFSTSSNSVLPCGLNQFHDTKPIKQVFSMFTNSTIHHARERGDMNIEINFTLDWKYRFILLVANVIFPWQLVRLTFLHGSTEKQTPTMARREKLFNTNGCHNMFVFLTCCIFLFFVFCICLFVCLSSSFCSIQVQNDENFSIPMDVTICLCFKSSPVFARRAYREVT